MTAALSANLRNLRKELAKIVGHTTDLGVGSPPLAFDTPEIDIHLQGGLVPASLHEMAPEAPHDFAASVGFVMALAIRAQRLRATRQTLWIQTDYAAREGGDLYGPGGEILGLPMRDLLILKVLRPVDALWAMEEALKSRAISCVVAELPNDAPLADLTATRRLTLAAREGKTFAFLLRHRPSPLTSSAETRWEIAAAPSVPDRFGGIGRTAFSLSLVKNRRGPTGRFVVAWDHHECVFSALSLGVAAAAADRPGRAARASTG